MTCLANCGEMKPSCIYFIGIIQNESCHTSIEPYRMYDYLCILIFCGDDNRSYAIKVLSQK